MGGAFREAVKLARAGFVLAREGVLTALAPPDPPPAARLALALARRIERRDAAPRDRAERLSDALARLGPSYVKLGQFLATRPDVVGDAVADDLQRLQDRMTPFPIAEARAAVAAAFDRPVGRLFVEFGPAVAAASIAQVHRAKVRDAEGAERAVAVKILRPGVASRFRADLEGFFRAARLIERFSPPARRLRPIAVVDTLARTTAIEMDLRLEAAALSEMAENTAEDPDFYVPAVDWERTAKTVLALQWIDGTKLSDIEGLLRAGHDLADLARALVQSFLRHALRDGFFHADMHPGNLFVDVSGRLVAVDLGIMGRLSLAERRFLAEILYGFISRNYRRVAEVHFEAGYVPATQDVDVFAQALRAIGEPLHGRPAADISMARLLSQLFEYTDLFAMQTQPQLVLLQKTMVVVEGVARRLDPAFDMWRTAEPVVRGWIERHLGPAGRLDEAAASLGAVQRLLVELPRLAERAETASRGLAAMAERGLVLHPATVEALAAAEARRTRSGRLALWIGAIALAVIAWAVL